MQSHSQESKCKFCGMPATAKIDDFYICDTCYVERGSCCTEFEPEAPEKTDTGT